MTIERTPAGARLERRGRERRFVEVAVDRWGIADATAEQQAAFRRLVGLCRAVHGERRQAACGRIGWDSGRTFQNVTARPGRCRSAPGWWTSPMRRAAF